MWMFGFLVFLGFLGFRAFEEHDPIRKGYIKLHIAVDIKNKKVIGDGAYDSRHLFNYLDKLGIQPIIRVRANSVAKARGSLVRKRNVISYKEDPDKWKKDNGYGQRWQCESAFSSIKRRFGEFIRRIKPHNIEREILMKCFVYNLVI